MNIRDFLRHLSQEALEDYCKAKKINFTLPKDSEPEERAESFANFLKENTQK